MKRAQAVSRDPWFPALCAAVVSVLASVVALIAAVVSSGSADGGPATLPADASPGPIATIAASGSLTVNGAVPAGLVRFGFRQADGRETGDLSFVGVSEGGVVTRHFVPVADLWAGVDSLSAQQLQGLLDGTTKDWADVGGLPGDVRVLSGPLPSQLRRGGEAVPTFEAIVEAIAPGSGIVALVPWPLVRPSLMPIAVDGVDLVRGRGDPAQWPYVERTSITANTRAGRAVLDAVIAASAESLPKPVTVVATGDILQSRCSLAKIRASGDWAAALRGATGEYLAAADLALVSLDASIQDVNPAWECVATTNLTSPAETIEALTLAGVDGATVATNHAFDCGQEFCGTRAFTRMLELLDAAGIRHVGGGLNLEQALAPAIFEVRGLRIGVLGFDDIAAMDLEATDSAPGTAPLDDDYTEEREAGEPAFFRPAEDLGVTRFVERITKLKAEVDVVLVQVQSGTENTHDPSPRSIKALRAAAGAGADLIVGNQAHWVQAVETRPKQFIAYALGNFIFDQVHSAEYTHGYLLEAAFIEKKLAAVKLVPYVIEDQHRPTFATGDVRLRILSDVFEASKRLPGEP